jgi:hypothetical protein
MLNLCQRAHTPRSHTPTDLHLASSLELQVVELSFRKVRSRDQERQAAFVVLESQSELVIGHS